MQNNQVLDELESYLEQQKSNNTLRIEVRLGTIIPKNKEAIQDLLYFQDACVNVESKIEKKNYRFEAAIGKEDFEKASKVIKSDDRWEFTLDIIFPISYMVSISYRIGLDEEGKVFCYERKKELKAKHLDVMDQSRQYRISLSQFENADYYQTPVCVEKIRDHLKNQKEIGCIRFKQTKIYYHDDESEQFVFQVQQVEKHKQAFLVEIAQNIVNDNNTFRKNVDNALNMFKDQAFYYKPFYEAEISLKQNKIAQSSAVLAEKYLEKIRQFHDNVRLMNPKIALSGLKDQQKQPEPNFNQQKGTRGNQPRTRGNNRPENDRQDNSNQILQDLAVDSQPKQFQQQQQNNYRGRGGRGGRGRGQAFHKDREDNDDDERYQSRTEDYL